MGVKVLNIEAQAKCSLFCEGIDSGIVLDSGDGVMTYNTIFDKTFAKERIFF